MLKVGCWVKYNGPLHNANEKWYKIRKIVSRLDNSFKVFLDLDYETTTLHLKEWIIRDINSYVSHNPKNRPES